MVDCRNGAAGLNADFIKIVCYMMVLFWRIGLLPKLPLLFLMLLPGMGFSQQAWQPAPVKISSTWAKEVSPQNVLSAYPRPQLVRKDWLNLNGLWKYTILPLSSAERPAVFDGEILVPFAVESSLSGVGKTVGKDSVLWYERSFSVPAAFHKGRVLLHFGAVDWQCDVFVNGSRVGTHQGGYDPFSIDISTALKKGGLQTLNVRVWDPSDAGPQPRGKQVKNPHSIWYTPVTGIWQTVWLEAVPQAYIASTRQTPDVDKGRLQFSADVAGVRPGDQLRLTVWEGNQKVAEQTSAANTTFSVAVPQPRLWSPQSPFLYNLNITLLRNGKAVDDVKSYFAMRKISLASDASGIQRLQLNNRFLFQFGPLDQGWWPDGLYTAPTDAALRYDLEQTKAMGFNTIRKHVKVEPARWYYYADSLGLLVWQDMPSGDLGNRWDSRPGVIGLATDKNRTPESEAIFRTEWKEIMQDLHNFPSIIVWVPFNEAWGQFKTTEIVQWTMEQDPSRLVNTASGGNFVSVGPIIDLHNYPDPAMPDPQLFGKTRALVLGEYGGLGLPVENHTWQEKNNWGYQSFKNAAELFRRYAGMIQDLENLIPLGLSAAIYTQTTDVEIETNGLMTYDRQVVKMPLDSLRAVNEKLYRIKVQ